MKFLFLFAGSVGAKVSAHKEENVSCVRRETEVVEKYFRAAVLF